MNETSSNGMNEKYWQLHRHWRNESKHERMNVSYKIEGDPAPQQLAMLLRCKNFIPVLVTETDKRITNIS